MKVPMKDWRFLGCTAEYAAASVALFGAPFDGTVTYRPGARFAPAAMRAESFGIETFSPYWDRDLEDCAVCDLGDIDIPIGNTALSLEWIGALTGQVLADGKKPLMVGGEHLISAPAVAACAQAYPGLAVVHFDAHADLREEYLGERLSHSTALRRAHEAVGDGSIFQFGIRSGTAEEFAWAAAHTTLHRFNLDGVAEAARVIGDRPVYLTVDLDVFDSSLLPGTGTPEAGGVLYPEFAAALLALRGLNLVAADVVELSPHYDSSGASTAVACKALRDVALLLAK